MIRLIIAIALIGSATASGLRLISPLWMLPAIFLEASWGLATGPMYDHIMTANKDGRLDVMPRMIAVRMALLTIPTGAVFGIARLFA